MLVTVFVSVVFFRDFLKTKDSEGELASGMIRCFQFGCLVAYMQNIQISGLYALRALYIQLLGPVHLVDF